MKNFALIGAGGYIAPKHMQAIMETGNNLIAALDKHDSVGVLDNYFPDAFFFTNIEKFKNFIQVTNNTDNPIDYLVVCSPNHLHEEHILIGLNYGVDVICEKPVALSAESIQRLMEAEIETGKKVFTIMQLRLLPVIKALKEKISNDADQWYDVQVKYITARGQWYHESWKGDVKRSGGIATNIGIHLFDLLLWFFGEAIESVVTSSTNEKITGELKFENAQVNWLLCIDEKELPAAVQTAGKRVYRSFTINENEIDFSEGTLSLHTASYQEIIEGNGFSLQATEPSVKLVATLKEQPVTVLSLS